MKKIYLFMLMAVGLLISGNAFGAKGQGHDSQQEGDVAKMTVDVAGIVTTTYYATLQDAFDDLPSNSYPVTLQLLDNVVLTVSKGFEIHKNNNVTLDLNGKMISASSEVASGSQVILNNGTLTITDESGTGEGIITSTAEKPDAAEGKPYPGWASNTITNYGTIYVKSGTINNIVTNPGSAQYAIDNHGTIIMEGGRLMGNVVIRTGYAALTKIEINGGEILGTLPIWAQLSKDQVADITINDGVLGKESNGTAINLQDWSNDYSALVKLHINNGTIYGDCRVEVATEECEITGGTFVKGTLKCSEYYPYPHNQIMTGGIFLGVSKELLPAYDPLGYCYKNETTGDNNENDVTQVTEWAKNNIQDRGDYWEINDGTNKVYLDNSTLNKTEFSDEQSVKNAIGSTFVFGDGIYAYGDGYGAFWAFGYPKESKSDYTQLATDAFEFIATGFSAQQYEGNGHPEDDIIIRPTTSKDITVDTDDSHNITWTGNATEPGQTNPQTTDVINITNNDASAQTTLEIKGDVDVYQINVNGKHNSTPGEAQIVVKDGATLNVGNGGIVSENDVLTTILVETGGTLIIGTNGIDQEGAATPIEIQASEEKGSGVLIFSPNATTAATQKYAEVDLYTYCKKVGEKYYWQQFAIPVTGLDNSKVVKNPNKTSYVFEWDYATYSWSQLNNWAQLDEPFAGYDMTNISENGGVVYTFKGDLIGNQNKQLTLPHKDYCVMGNSYTAPIDITALFDQINKEMSENTIEKTVYKYDAKAGYYVYTNELEQALDKMGVVKASFTEIKPMEGFLLNLQNGNTAGVMLNYANAVYTPAMTPNQPASAPRMANTDMVLAKINVKSAHAMDQMTLVESDEFSAEIENGKDAFKYLNEGANLYAFDGTNKLAMVATDNLEGTMLAFQAAEDEEYTLTFDRALNADYILMDMLTGEKVAMVEGNTYTFTATPNTLNPGRFMIVATAKAPTDMVNTKANKAVKGVYTIMGQYLGNGEMWNELPQGVYMVNGVKVIK